MRVCVHACMCACVHVHVCMCYYVYTYMYVDMCVCLYRSDAFYGLAGTYTKELIKTV